MRKIRKVEQVDWEPLASRVVPLANLPALPERGAGCLVIGHYILADGTTGKSRVMQGAYTKGTPAEAQKAFADAALTASASWKYRYKGRFTRPEPAFEWTVAGYRPTNDERRLEAVEGLEAQDPRVRAACDIVDLATWGARHARTAGQLPASDKILLPYEEPSEAFWAAIGEMTPPRYPPAAFQSGVEGCVIVGMVVKADGVPDQFRIMESRTSHGADARAKKLLENASAHAASQWRFAPGPDNPERIPALLQIPVDFALGDGRPSRKSDCQPVDIRKRLP